MIVINRQTLWEAKEGRERGMLREGEGLKGKAFQIVWAEVPSRPKQAELRGADLNEITVRHSAERAQAQGGLVLVPACLVSFTRRRKQVRKLGRRPLSPLLAPHHPMRAVGRECTQLGLGRTLGSEVTQC